MSWLDRDLECPRCAEAAAFVLGALADEEHEFRAHLAACTACQVEVAELRRVIDAVPTTARPAPVSEDLHERVMVIVRTEAEVLKAAGPGADMVPRRRPRWRLLAGAGAVAAAAAASIAIVDFSEKAMRTIPARIASARPSARATLLEVDDRGELVLSGMAQAPRGKAYEVWVRTARQAPMPTDALFTVSRQGSSTVDVPGSLSGVREVLVSAEPLGGSSHLSGPVLIRVRVPS